MENFKTSDGLCYVKQSAVREINKKLIEVDYKRLIVADRRILILA